MLKFNDLMQESVPSLKLKLRELEENLFKLVSDKNINRKIDKPHRIKFARRDKARVLTAIRNKAVGKEGA